jgi:hypothetical protein
MKKPYSTAYNVLKIMGVPVFTNEDNDELGNFFICELDLRDFASSAIDFDSCWIRHWILHIGRRLSIAGC